jgi:hypothetical protein
MWQNARFPAVPVCTIVIVMAGLASAFGGEGRVVILGDDWMVADEWWNRGHSIELLVDNSLNWLAETSPGDSALVSQYFEDWLHHSNLFDRMAIAGFQRTMSETPAWTPETVAQYDLVVASFSEGVDTDVMTHYVRSGGNVLLITGEARHYRDVQAFAGAFGIEVLNEPNPSGGPVGSTSSFRAHAVTAGLQSLDYSGPAPMDLDVTDSRASVLITFPYEGEDYGLVAVFDGTVPEPSAAALLSVGALIGLLAYGWRRCKPAA